MTWTGPADDTSQTTDSNGLLMLIGNQFVAVAGSTIVVPAIDANRVDGSAQATLQFRDVATGKIKTTKQLPVGKLGGMSSDTVAGHPVLVVRYQSTAPDIEQANGGEPVNVTQVFAEDGSILWTSDGTADSTNQDGTTFPTFTTGYWLHDDRQRAVTSLMDTSGRAILSIPNYGDSSGDANRVTVAGGYLVAGFIDEGANAGSFGATPLKAHIKIYDLAQGAKQVGSLDVPAAGGGTDVHLIAASGAKLLIGWPTRDMPSGQALAVFDAATGRTTAPIAGPSVSLAMLTGTTDPNTHNALIYSTNPSTTAASQMVSLDSGKTLWTQPSSAIPLYPTSLHKGTLYGVEIDSGNHKITRLALAEASGSELTSDFDVAPVSYTPQGAIFVQDANAAGGSSALMIGVCPPTS